MIETQSAFIAVIHRESLGAWISNHLMQADEKLASAQEVLKKTPLSEEKLLELWEEQKAALTQDKPCECYFFIAPVLL